MTDAQYPGDNWPHGQKQQVCCGEEETTELVSDKPSAAHRAQGTAVLHLRFPTKQ